MWFETLIREETGCATYMIGCQRTGDCMVFDPLWDIEPYLKMAKKKKSKIKYVIDSHSHADQISGARRLVKETGAELFLPELAEISYEATRLKGGDEIRMGGVGLRVFHAPGHRPEQINLLIIDYPRGDEPWAMLTADFVMVGDVARPDLAQGGVSGAEQLFNDSIPRFLELPDHVEVYPGHLAGST
ncbi:MAG: MBL fold metallo-hydrolase [Chloroflexota bacterium]